jgi:hypothetical protein
MVQDVCMLKNKRINQQANGQLYSNLEKGKREKKIRCCWKNKRYVSPHTILRYMYKSGYTRKDRKEKGNGASMS